jgi:hypothetical protein
MKTNGVIRLAIYLFFLFGCALQQKIVYFEFATDSEKKYKIYFGQKGYKPLSKDKNGNYSVALDSTVLYTSTSYKDIANVKSLFRIRGEPDFVSTNIMEEKRGLKVIENVVGKDYTTPDGYMIPQHFEIILEKKK